MSGIDSQNNYGFRYNAFGVVSSQYQNDDDDWDDDDYSASSIHTRTNNLIPYQYTGKYRESISGFNHMDARWYNPKVGRFIQPDQYNHANLMLPKGAQSELMRYIGRTQSDLLKDPSQQMRYGYVSGNALRWVDPLGLAPDKEIDVVGFVVIDSTSEAIDHYYNGYGVPAALGEYTINAVINNDTHKGKEDKIIAGNSTSLSGDYGINLTWNLNTYHVGDTPIVYKTICDSYETCKTTFTAFSNDGFWDADIFANDDDGPGPEAEYEGGVVYPYIPYEWTIEYDNPYPTEAIPWQPYDPCRSDKPKTTGAQS
ncbi:RHS repeat-associated core domain-containing protein [Reinekea marina]|uniref:RHS repeat-associated core domain-containing protein n=1 Tax=Reinekea marina TaxID=1310421 RepID=A0ABV7WVL7_9GAMM|nr:RHS repeat-associated core domain-containing protein [Reinekea marina]MDN3649166.1 RHS repeat-associated core domain-containing protein [Reinekea marina]